MKKMIKSNISFCLKSRKTFFFSNYEIEEKMLWFPPLFNNYQTKIF